MPELLFLLLPLAALYGYIMGRNSYRQAQLKQHEKINQDFLSGLNLLLNNQRDKAINVLIENLEVNNETFTTHIALGKLFRAKGENDRAIKIHQFLAKQDTLTPEQRRESIVQLARDYIDCALYDRAEQLLLPLLSEDKCDRDARKMLSQIYQVFKDWDKAFDAIKPLESEDNDSYDITKAYLLCEIASTQPDINKLAMLHQAIDYRSDCARAYLDLMDYYLAQDSIHDAQNLCDRFAAECPAFIALLIPKLVFIYPSETEKLTFLLKINEIIKSSAVVKAITEIYEKQQKNTEARKIVLVMLEKHATIAGFANLLKLNANKIDSLDSRQTMLNLEKMVVTKINQLPNYECDQCGYQGSMLFWQCPRCKSWGSIKPTTGLTGD